MNKVQGLFGAGRVGVAADVFLSSLHCEINAHKMIFHAIILFGLPAVAVN